MGVLTAVALLMAGLVSVSTLLIVYHHRKRGKSAATAAVAAPNMTIQDQPLPSFYDQATNNSFDPTTHPGQFTITANPFLSGSGGGSEYACVELPTASLASVRTRPQPPPLPNVMASRANSVSSDVVHRHQAALHQQAATYNLGSYFPRVANSEPLTRKSYSHHSSSSAASATAMEYDFKVLALCYLFDAKIHLD